MIGSTKRNGFSSIFKGVKNNPRGFKFKPRIYDADAERLEKRKEVIAKEMEAAKKIGQKYTVSRGQDSAASYLRKERKRQHNMRLIRLAVILFGMLVFFRVLWAFLLSRGYIS